MTILLALACATLDTTPILAADADTGVDTGTSADTGDTTDCFQVGEGLTLFNLPRDELILVSVVDEYGKVVYQESLTSDACGTATPFEGVAIDDLDPDGLDEGSSVYALVVEEPQFYLFLGVFVDAQSELPISTQWEPVGDGQWVAIRDELGVLVGPMMIP